MPRRLASRLCSEPVDQQQIHRRETSLENPEAGYRPEAARVPSARNKQRDYERDVIHDLRRLGQLVATLNSRC